MRPRPPSINPPAVAPQGRSRNWDSGDSPDLAYVHQARRLRRLYADNPAILHQRLKRLSNTLRRPGSTAKPTYSSDSPVARHFAQRVAVRLPRDSNLLSYSARLNLLKEAQSLGISRFEANLIIAITQHRHTPSPAPDHPAPRRPNTWWLPLTAALALQSSLVLLAWYTLLR